MTCCVCGEGVTPMRDGGEGITVLRETSELLMAHIECYEKDETLDWFGAYSCAGL